MGRNARSDLEGGSAQWRTNWAHGVVVSHPLRMRKALGSNPSVSIFHESSCFPRELSKARPCAQRTPVQAHDEAFDLMKCDQYLLAITLYERDSKDFQKTNAILKYGAAMPRLARCSAEMTISWHAAYALDACHCATAAISVLHLCKWSSCGAWRLRFRTRNS